MVRNKPANPFVWEWMLTEDVDEANRVAKMLLLELPLLLELQLLLQLAVTFVKEGISSKICVGEGFGVVFSVNIQ